MELLIWLAITGAASITGYIQSRRFVRRKLRFVDAVQRPSAAVVAGVGAAVVAAPVAWLLPWVGPIAAAVFGAGVGVGVHHGAKDTKRLPGI
ncbi:MAG: hypothetical protein GTN62_04975 [Gemmatimonadales bacterium]|nr:hypothetical protein [Gemmatimonadales bacterium]NIN10806.1 hypothetical protein [Gemmatimonadales bacterium]NIN49450.1 hypothetical protein [Gemmatimonadales bacterium]NIP06914.1 hypothetical protein [Gemmatimonadales bacterium]NIR02850.1 hypothetical protein [Gemmatimonadales bacterium]